MKVKVYYNLHNHKWSLQDAVSGLVLGHASCVALSNVTPKVSEAGRQRVLKEKRKNVHAFLVGELATVFDFTSFKGRNLEGRYHAIMYPPNIENTVGVKRVTYNPYTMDRFMYRDTPDLAVVHMGQCYLDDMRRVWGVDCIYHTLEKQFEMFEGTVEQI